MVVFGTFREIKKFKMANPRWLPFGTNDVIPTSCNVKKNVIGFMLWTSKGNSLDVLYTLEVSLSKLQYFRVKEGDGIQSLVPVHDEQKIARSE